MNHTVTMDEEDSQTGSGTRSDLRAHKRLSVSGPIVLLWKEGERVRSMYGLAKNLSAGGALVRSYRGLPVGAFVRLRSNKLFFMTGCAKVQHCTRRGLTYHIGLKFYSDLSTRF